jgi:pimeloyl-ACP methyl ester carboxylesterase
VSTPPFLDLPPGALAVRLATSRGELAAHVAGAGEPGRAPVLLVPGFTGSKEDFIALIEPVAAGGHRVVAIDLRGQFESPWAGGESSAAAYDVKELAEEVLDVARDLGGPVHLLGHSFGGLVARAAALADPSAIRSLTILASGPAAIPHPAASNLELISRALPVMDMESIWTAKRQLELQGELIAPPAEVEDFLHRRFVANDPACLLRMAEQLLTADDRVDELAGLGLPTLVAWGPDDDAWPPAAQQAMALRLAARTAVIAGAGHSPAADNPEGTAAALLDFWAAVDGG